MSERIDEAKKSVMNLLNTFPADALSKEFKDGFADWLEEGRPAEYYEGIMRGIIEAASHTLGMGKKGQKIRLQLMEMSIGVAIRYKESCSMEVK